MNSGMVDALCQGLPQVPSHLAAYIASLANGQWEIKLVHFLGDHFQLREAMIELSWSVSFMPSVVKIKKLSHIIK
jgi:hypothetical protein